MTAARSSCSLLLRRHLLEPLPQHVEVPRPAVLVPVAHLVAQGLSNRETADRLYVSVKAVEYHLGHIYAKLGISSRRQLAGRLAEPQYG